MNIEELGVQMIPFSALYVFFAVVTFGHLYRSRLGKPLPRDVLYSLAWPAWWLVSHGVGGTLEIAIAAITPQDNKLFWIALCAWLFTGSYYFTKAWPACEGAISCSAVIIKMVVATPLFPLFWGWEIANLTR